ncbi:hypothetical protein [Candidatus Mycobacterium methanotrophicum]|uniref:Uncharacterized protein n=1 Tax=Candidatus Mycobacterium methanotrophicum TaxID=2943498 RepID=A0ABY4QTS5_9MYCO|nr:hypothetical protein [Candidatus Mycobacterium methanotrophicum]UQX13576.1 hypothetical protein M5I08_25645 [Candidatus Mycobacterium methanotrophicum]
MSGVGRHVVIVAAAGSFAAAGGRLSGPVDTAGKLAALIAWARERGGLRPIPGPGDRPARVWVVGSAVGLLTGGCGDDGGDPGGGLGRVLAALVDDGWELAPGAAGSAVVLARGRGERRLAVEVVAERWPWLAGGDASVAEDAVELGRRLGCWYAELGVLPRENGAVSGAALADRIMAGRAAAGRGAVVGEPGELPGRAVPELRVQPAWAASGEQVERELAHCEELVCVTQACPGLASAGMLTFGHGRPQQLEGQAAHMAAASPKRPFGLWLVELPAAAEVPGLPAMLPVPHPQMAAGHRVQAWVSSEDLDGLAKDVRDGGAGLGVERLGVHGAIVWPRKTRILEGWAARLRQAREAFAGDAPVLASADAAAADYLASLGDRHAWAEEMRHHFQPAWAAAIAAHTRFRGRRAAMRISREHHAWPIYVENTAMVYGPSAGDDGTPDLSDTHTRLGRLVTAARAELTDQTILALLLAESAGDAAAALNTALGDAALSAAPAEPAAGPHTGGAGEHAAPGAYSGSVAGDGEPGAGGPETGPPAAAAAKLPARRAGRHTTNRAGLGGTPAAVLHTDGLWMPDGVKIPVPQPITHAGHVAQLAYTHQLGYQLTPDRPDGKPGYGEPGQVWITDQACRAFGVDVDAVVEKKPKDRDTAVRAVTEGIGFVADAAAEGWRIGGAGPDASATRLGVWTRVYRDDQQRKGVWLVLIPGMAAVGDAPQDLRNTPILIGGHTEDGIEIPSPDRIARRLQLLADALGYPYKLNAGVTAIDLMVTARPKGATIAEWRNGPLAPSSFEPPFTVGDVERDFNWTRTPTAAESTCRYVHAYDRGGSYPAAIAGLELPIGEPVHYPDGAVFADPARLAELLKAPGLATIIVPEAADWRAPHLLNPAGLRFHAPKPVTTARLGQAIELGYTPTIVEAYSWPQHGRVLKGWYERIRNAATALDTDDPDAQAARDQSKVVRSVGIGLMGSQQHMKGKTGYDPMKRLSIIGKASANIAYRIDRIGQATGRWPVAVEKDTVLYVSDNPDPQSAWPGGPKTWGRGFGQYKHEGSVLLADHTQYLSGGAYSGRAALLEPHDWTQLAASADTTAG